MSNTSAQTEQLVKARQLLDEGHVEEAGLLLKDYLLDATSDTDGLKLFATVLDEAGRAEASQHIRALAEKIDSTISSGMLPYADPDIAQNLFHAGFALTDIRQFDLAAKILDQAIKLTPDEPVIRYELGFALMALNRFDEAVPHFQAAAKELNDFDTTLNLGVCHLLTRKLKPAKEIFDQLAKLAESEDERKELAHRRMVLKRMEELGSHQTLTARDWLFALYGSLLLHPGYKSGDSAEDLKSIASTALVLRGVLEGLRIEIEVIEFYNPMSKPLARLISEVMELPVDSYKGPDRPDKALLVMAWATDLIGPHQAFIETSERRTLFAYGLPWREPLPLVPEIVGCLADQCPMPWDETTRSASIDSIVADILEKARHLESDPDILRQTQEALEYYHLKRERVMLGNHDAFPERPEYTAEIPK